MSSYRWFENNLLDDNSMSVVAISFPIIKGWIDSDLGLNTGEIPDYSKNALNTISSSISNRLESQGIHSFIYASQKWGEIAKVFPYPNSIFIVAINPFSSFRTSIQDGSVNGESNPIRLSEVQSIYERSRHDWLLCIHLFFHLT